MMRTHPQQPNILVRGDGSSGAGQGRFTSSELSGFQEVTYNPSTSSLVILAVLRGCSSHPLSSQDSSQPCPGLLPPWFTEIWDTVNWARHQGDKGATPLLCPHSKKLRLYNEAEADPSPPQADTPPTSGDSLLPSPTVVPPPCRMNFLLGGPAFCSVLLLEIRPITPSGSRFLRTHGGSLGLPLWAPCNASSKRRAFLEEMRLHWRLWVAILEATHLSLSNSLSVRNQGL